jgi:quinol monooxygenase YgiN
MKPPAEGNRTAAGNISCDLCEDVKNPDIFTFAERLEDEETVKKHQASVHFKQAIPKYPYHPVRQ